MCPLKPLPSTLLLILSLCLFSAPLFAQDKNLSEADRARRHEDAQWQTVQQHLPDPSSASPVSLEVQGDLLRIRRFPEDALDYYGYAVKRGGNSAALMNKIGLTQMELRNFVLAEGYFRQAIKLDRRDERGWNNLAAIEFLQREYGAAISDYKHAIKLNRKTAVFHANLSAAYFELKNYKNARHEVDEALTLDPQVFHHSNGAGVEAHILSVEDHARFSFEMAKLYAQHGDEVEMLHALAMACESGFDVAGNMAKDPTLAKYKNDPRVALIIMTAKALHLNTTPVLTSAATLAPHSGPGVETR
ncbi:tetratricopeptide repeat protein [Granulicella arctica]|uniref:Tetratricopeptide (TPR) repeat protein n=1 Tax=Granulicella arctica TaxID=940613 RepID=A0A7Y9PGA0_9BACT|nr:tetratricopeptide repeat protein [Granulicella arctica]NYF79292.1 tetratricopeptide (TPR) repeat protein [Granulicella arctica]